jgi:predicted nuclease with TOPRIM domain
LEGHDPGCPYENGATPWFEDRIAELQAENAKLKVNLEQSREQEKQTAMTLDGFVGDLEKAHNAQVPTEILCPECGKLHVDQDEWATTRLHRKHLCHGCGHVWQPYVVTTTGVDFHVGCQERIARAEADVTWIRSAWQTEIEENKKLGKELHEALTENAQLHTRRDELLAMVAQLSQTVPLDSEVAEALNQRGALLAEVGTLKARIAELESMLPAQPGKG